MTQFSNKFKKPCFWPIFPIFGAKKMFLENPAPSRTTSYGFLASCQNLEKVNDTIQRKCPDRWTEGGKDRRTDRPYFIGPFRLPPGVQKITIWKNPKPLTIWLKLDHVSKWKTKLESVDIYLPQSINQSINQSIDPSQNRPIFLTL